MNTDLKRYLYNSVYSEIHGKAPLLSDVPEELLPNHKNKNQKIHQDRFRTLVSDKPSKTITSHISKDGHNAAVIVTAHQMSMSEHLISLVNENASGRLIKIIATPNHREINDELHATLAESEIHLLQY